MSDQKKKNVLIDVVVGALIVAFVVGLNLYNIHRRIERDVYSSDKWESSFRVKADTQYGGFGKTPSVVSKEEEPVLVFLAYSADKEEGYYEIYGLSRKYAKDHLWQGPVEKGNFTSQEGEKTVAVDLKKQGDYQVKLTIPHQDVKQVKIQIQED